MNVYQVKSPSRIVTDQLNISLEYKQECIGECYKIGDKQKHSTNLKAIMSSYFVWEETDKFNPIFDNIIRFITSNLLEDKRYKAQLSEAWSAIYQKGHYATAHKHNPSSWSWVYYLKANKDTPLVFDECGFKLEPYDEMLVVFESSLLHSVGKHMGEDDRVCLAGNIDLIERHVIVEKGTSTKIK